jgi:hypothetical protein
MENVATPKREITINSNWIMTVCMAMLLLICVGLLIWDIRNLLFDRVDKSFSLISLIIGVAYSFAFAYLFPAKSLKLAFLLLGTEKVVRGALYYLHASMTVQHLAATGASIARQIAFTIIIVAIVLWFRSVVRWNPIIRTSA